METSPESSNSSQSTSLSTPRGRNKKVYVLPDLSAARIRDILVAVVPYEIPDKAIMYINRIDLSITLQWED